MTDTTTSSRTCRRRPWGVLVGLVVIAGAAVLIWQHSFATYHLATVQPGVLYRDGSRSVRELSRAVQTVGARTVVSLVDDDEVRDPAKPQFRAEADYLAAHGIGYQRIPVKLGGWPTTEDVQKFLASAEDPKNRPVLLHCAQGVRRTAMFVAAYQESVLGYDKARAKQAILTFGYSAATVHDIERFIDGYDPTSRTVSTDSAASAE